MNKHATPAPPKLFQSPLLYSAAALYVLGALLGLIAVVFLFLPGSVDVLIHDLLDRGIVDLSAVRTWTIIHIGLILTGAICAVVMAVGILLERWRKGDGLDLMYHVARVLLVLVKAGGVLALVTIILRLGLYLMRCDWAYTGVYQAYGLLLTEGIMIAQAVGMFALLLRFLDHATDTAASIAYTRASGKLDNYPIPGFCATGFFLLSLVNLHLAWDWGATLHMDGGFRVVLSSNPMLLLAAGMFACGAISNLLICLYIKYFKRTTEVLVYRAMRDMLSQSTQ